MDEGVKKKSNIGWIILLVILGAIIAVFAVPAIQQSHEKLRKQELVEEARAYFENEIPNDIRKAYEGFTVPGDLEIKAISEWGDSSLHHEPVYYWKDTLRVTLHTDESFDELEDREKYNLIGDFGWTGIDAFQKEMEEKFPGYFTYGMTIGAYDRTVLFDIDYHFYIKSPKCTYRYLGKQDSYGIGTGSQVHYLTDPQSKYYVDPNKPTPTPTPQPTKFPAYTPKKNTSSQKTSRTDPYEAHLYSDPDEYAFDYAEEFADEIGEDEDEGYLEAYDHWEYWHEMNG